MEVNLIDLSDSEDFEVNDTDNETIDNNNKNNDDKTTDNDKNNLNKENGNDEIMEIGDKEDNITLIKKEKIEHSNPNVMNFIKFCIEMRLFDDNFYDFGNAFSIMATKLPTTFDLMSKDGKMIEKEVFISYFKQEKYEGDLEDIFSEIDNDKTGFISWENFIEFFIPFVRYVTI